MDLSDAYLTSYPSARKSLKKYYIKQFRHVLDMATFNALILYQKCGGPMTRLTFILTLIDEAPLFLLTIEKHHCFYHATPGRPSGLQNPLPDGKTLSRLCSCDVYQLKANTLLSCLSFKADQKANTLPVQGV